MPGGGAGEKEGGGARGSRDIVEVRDSDTSVRVGRDWG